MSLDKHMVHKKEKAKTGGWKRGWKHVTALLVLLLAGTGPGAVLAADIPPMPNIADHYTPAAVVPIYVCPPVVRVGYEAADGSTADDSAYPLIAWYLADDNARPFLVVLFDSQDGRVRVFWIDYDRDGNPDEFGDLKRLQEVIPTDNVCDLAERVK